MSTLPSNFGPLFFSKI